MDKQNQLTPQQRLAQSHQAIVRQMGQEAPDESVLNNGSDSDNQQIDTSAGTWDLMKQVVGAWWRGHPAYLAMDVAKPVLRSYAEEKPLKLLGICAGVGAAVVLLRPWRLISVTGLLLAAVKSSEMTGVVRSLMSPGSPTRHR